MCVTTVNEVDSAREVKEPAGSIVASNNDTLEILKGATELAQKVGFSGKSLTPFVNEYLYRKEESSSERA